MPIARNPAQHNYHWIPREAETEFQNLLKDGKAYVLPIALLRTLAGTISGRTSETQASIL